MPRKNVQSKVSAERAKLFKLLFSNPISGLTPARLISRLNAWQRGEIRDAALLFQQIIERDDQVGPCANKRTRAVSRLTWQILPVDDSPPAATHKEKLEHFYNNLTAFDGLNEMDRGGVRKLVKQMLTAIGMRYAMHEIIWKPAAPGGLTAEFKFLPLQFFENTTGRLRFLQADHAMYGSDLDEFFGPGGWMCTAGDGLMIACSIAYLFKTPTGLKAWVSFMEKFGMPGLHAETSAQKGTSEWDDLVAALAAYAEDFAMVTSQGTKINPIESKTGGNAPHPVLVERMDRAISRIWMGGDLATMSKDNQAVGSQPQSDDLDMLREDDAEMVTEALNEYVDTQVIRQLFGDTSPLAYFKLVVPKKKSTDDSVKRIETGQKYGVPISTAFVRQELNLPEPDDEDDLIKAPAAPLQQPGNPFFNAANERTGGTADARFEIFRAQSLRRLSRAQADALRPLTDRLSEILGMEDEVQQDAALLKLQNDLPTIYRSVLRDPDLIKIWEEILGTALVGGAVDSAEKKTTPTAS